MRERFYLDPIEVAPREEINDLQLRKLKSTIKYAYDRSPFYRRRFDKVKFKPEDLRDFEDIQRIPVLRKEDVRKERERTGDPFAEMLAVPYEELLGVWSSTGTSGVPTFSAFTVEDKNDMGHAFARHAWAEGIRPGMKGIGIFLNWHWTFQGPTQYCFDLIGARVINEEVIPIPPLMSRWIYTIRRFKPQFLWGNGDVLVGINEAAKDAGYDPKDVFSVLKIAMGTLRESLSDRAIERYKEAWGVEEFYNWDAISGEVAICSFLECHEHRRHSWEDLGYMEIVNPDTDELVRIGERGEVVVTNFCSRAIPYIRWGTEDMGALEEEPCPCGRTHRTGYLLGRTFQRVNVAGKNYFFFDIRPFFEEFPETKEAHVALVKDAPIMNKLKMRAAYDADITKDPGELRQRISRRIKEGLGIDSEIEWTPLETLKVLKAVRFIDESKKAVQNTISGI